MSDSFDPFKLDDLPKASNNPFGLDNGDSDPPASNVDSSAADLILNAARRNAEADCFEPQTSNTLGLNKDSDDESEEEGTGNTPSNGELLAALQNTLSSSALGNPTVTDNSKIKSPAPAQKEVSPGNTFVTNNTGARNNSTASNVGNANLALNASTNTPGNTNSGNANAGNKNSGNANAGNNTAEPAGLGASKLEQLLNSSSVLRNVAAAQGINDLGSLQQAIVDKLKDKIDKGGLHNSDLFLRLLGNGNSSGSNGNINNQNVNVNTVNPNVMNGNGNLSVTNGNVGGNNNTNVTVNNGIGNNGNNMGFGNVDANMLLRNVARGPQQQKKSLPIPIMPGGFPIPDMNPPIGPPPNMMKKIMIGNDNGKPPMRNSNSNLGNNLGRTGSGGPSWEDDLKRRTYINPKTNVETIDFRFGGQHGEGNGGSGAMNSIGKPGGNGGGSDPQILAKIMEKLKSEDQDMDANNRNPMNSATISKVINTLISKSIGKPTQGLKLNPNPTTSADVLEKLEKFQSSSNMLAHQPNTKNQVSALATALIAENNQSQQQFGANAKVSANTQFGASNGANNQFGASSQQFGGINGTNNSKKKREASSLFAPAVKKRKLDPMAQCAPFLAQYNITGEQLITFLELWKEASNSKVDSNGERVDSVRIDSSKPDSDVESKTADNAMEGEKDTELCPKNYSIRNDPKWRCVNCTTKNSDMDRICSECGDIREGSQWFCRVTCSWQDKEENELECMHCGRPRELCEATVEEEILKLCGFTRTDDDEEIAYADLVKSMMSVTVRQLQAYNKHYFKRKGDQQGVSKDNSKDSHISSSVAESKSTDVISKSTCA